MIDYNPLLDEPESLIDNLAEVRGLVSKHDMLGAYALLSDLIGDLEEVADLAELADISDQDLRDILRDIHNTDTDTEEREVEDYD